MRIQSAIVAYLQQASTATYALVASRTSWAIPETNPALPFIRVRKAGHRPLAKAMATQTQYPSEANIEIIAYAKSQDGAADIMDAVTADLLAVISQRLPVTSPVTAGVPWVNMIHVADEEDLVSEEARAKGIFAEARTYSVIYDFRP